MATASKLHWFQFGFGTWFILVGLLAWGLAIRPYTIKVEPHPVSQMRSGIFKFRETWTPTPTLFGKTFYIDIDGDGWEEECGFTPRILWPIFALIAFVAGQFLWRSHGELMQFNHRLTNAIVSHWFRLNCPMSTAP